MGRELILERKLPWRGLLSRPDPRTRPTYAVLAILSDCYPPLKGRLFTCYSPVRHFTMGRSPILVRLACVRPAANVRSEPGSNSPVIKPKTLKHRTGDDGPDFRNVLSSGPVGGPGRARNTDERFLSLHRQTIQFSRSDCTEKGS